ncbi:MAG: glycosyltransferase [Bacilli bacterium]|nr:glycosyltransferase [Bacilli bacterium]
MAIPKIIHYVWMGGKEKPRAIKKCMKTWNKFLSDYKIIEWNEGNFDIKSHPYVYAAYKTKKWAFVSDYVRAWVIYTYGGIYLDTDVFVIDNLDVLLENKAFVGYEKEDYPFTAVFGAEKGHPFIKDILNYYDNIENYEFEFNNNNTISVSDLLTDKYDCKKGNIEQTLRTGIKVYKDNVLCNPSLDSLTVHLFYGSWTDKGKFRRWEHDFLRMKLSNKFNIRLYVYYKKIRSKVRGR